MRSTVAQHGKGQAWQCLGSTAPGITVVELLLAMATTAVIGGAVAAMLTATSYGTDSSRDLRELIVRCKTVSSRINDAVRQSDRVLAVGEHHLVLWRDDDGDGEPSLHELIRLQFDAQAGELRAHTAPSTAGDTAWPLDADFTAITEALMTGSSFPPRRWASGIAAWQTTLDDSDPHAARLVSYRMTLQAGDLHESTINAASLRNR